MVEGNDVAAALAQAGLTDAEIRVYLTLLEIGPTTTGPIIEKSQTATSKIYVILEKLIAKGLATSFTERSVKHYNAAAPTQIIRYLKEREVELQRQQQNMMQFMPLLTSLRDKHDATPEAAVFRGGKGMRTAFSELVDALEPGSEIHIMGTYNFVGAYKSHATYFQKIRSQKNIKAKYVMNQEAKPIADHFYNYPPIEVRLLDEGTLPPTIFIMYKNNIIISLGDDMVMFRIASRRVASAFEAYFQQFWKQAQPYKPKMQRVKKISASLQA